MSNPNPRTYSVGLCYICQTCLYCFKNCSHQTCQCKDKKKTPLKKKGQKKKFYTQMYQPNSWDKNSFNVLQTNELKHISNYYGYDTDFSEKFCFSTCTKCHAKFWRLGKQNITQNELGNNQPDVNQFSLSDNNELEESKVIANQFSSLYINKPKKAQVNTSQTALSSNELEEIQVKSNLPEFADNSVQDSSPTPTFTSSEDEYTNSAGEMEFVEITFKLIIKTADGRCNAAKWESILTDNFQQFRNKLDRLIQEQFEDQIVFKGDYNIAYKQEKEAGQGTQLTNNTDWERFLKENERIVSQKKVLVILVTMKKKPKKIILRDSNDQVEELMEKRMNKPVEKKNKDKSSNKIPKEKNVNDFDAIIAQNIMEIHSKWNCKEHNRSCYVDSTRHISLTTNHLSTWARSIEHNLATLDDPPTLPLFNATNNMRKCNNSNNNVQNVQSTQMSNSFYSQTGFFPVLVHPNMFNQHDSNFTNSSLQVQKTNITAPSINEFFENLDEKYGECNFSEAKSKFLQEEIDVLDILNLSDYDWQRLEIKLGIKAKILREAEKYCK